MEKRGTDGTLVRAIGEACWGEHWKKPMAGFLDVNRSSVDDWARDKWPVPADVWTKLEALVEQRGAALAGLAPRILTAKAEAEKRR